MAGNKNENPGCLTSIFSLFGGRKETSSGVTVSVTETPVDLSRGTLPYRLRDDFLSPAEFSFFKVLSSLAGNRVSIQCKVRLADIFFVARPNENPGYFNRIASKHVDFLVCEPNTMKPLAGIELDDASHQKDNRRERDEFVDAVFEVAGLPLVHFPNQRAYTAEEIISEMALHVDLFAIKPPQPMPTGAPLTRIGDPLPAPAAAQNTSAEEQAPLCPKCGLPMVLRTVSQGEHKGKQFYGCSNYPQCRVMKPYPNRGG